LTSKERISRLFKRFISDPELKKNPANMLSFDVEPSCVSHFKPVDRARLTREEMETVPGTDELEMLERVWAGTDSDLTDLIPELREISRMVSDERDKSDRRSPDLSDFIYQMW